MNKIVCIGAFIMAAMFSAKADAGTVFCPETNAASQVEPVKGVWKVRYFGSLEKVVLSQSARGPQGEVFVTCHRALGAVQVITESCRMDGGEGKIRVLKSAEFELNECILPTTTYNRTNDRACVISCE